MKTVIMKIVFEVKGIDRGKVIQMTVPENISIGDVYIILSDEHNYLDNIKNDVSVYSEKGRTPDTLLNYVCEKYAWTWSEIKAEIEIKFE